MRREEGGVRREMRLVTKTVRRFSCAVFRAPLFVRGAGWGGVAVGWLRGWARVAKFLPARR